MRATQSLTMFHEVDPKQILLAQVSDQVAKIRPQNALVLLAVYERPAKTLGGVILPDKALEEDRYQGKVGLVVKLGPLAFQDDATHKWPADHAVLGDWVVFRPADAWQALSGKNMLRFIEDGFIRAVIDDPDVLY